MHGALMKRFDRPDETRTFEKGRFDLIRIGGMTLGRATYEPGWKWSKHVAPQAKTGAGTPSCQVSHLGMVITGRAMVAMDGGEAFEMRPGDVFAVEPGHDSWVVGDEPYVSIHFLGADEYAR